MGTTDFMTEKHRQTRYTAQRMHNLFIQSIAVDRIFAGIQIELIPFISLESQIGRPVWEKLVQCHFSDTFSLFNGQSGLTFGKKWVWRIIVEQKMAAPVCCVWPRKRNSLTFPYFSNLNGCTIHSFLQVTNDTERRRKPTRVKWRKKSTHTKKVERYTVQWNV